MSYILDALRRAEAERERGAVPGLQSQQHTVTDEDEAAPPAPRRLMWAVVGLGAALALVLAWTLFGASPAPAPARPTADATQPPSTAFPAPGPVAATTAPATNTLTPAMTAADTAAPSAAPTATTAVLPAPMATVPTASPAPRATTPTSTIPAAPAQLAIAVPGSRAAAEESRRANRRNAAEVRTPLPSTGSAASNAAPRSEVRAEPRVYAQAELPDEVRRELPRLAVNGSSYSGDATSRMVMINGQIFHEGDNLGTGVVLEKILRRSAVLSYKGWRYELAF